MGNNSVPKFIFRLSRLPVYRGSVLGRFYCTTLLSTVPEILQAVDRSIRTINTTGAAKVILRLPHRWKRVVDNAYDYNEGQ